MTIIREDAQPAVTHRMALPGWHRHPGLSDYAATLAEMERTVAQILDGTAGEQIWLVEHPPVVTAGTSADVSELVDAGRFPVVAAGRGGRFTYHGPGQRVVYPMLDLGARGRDVHAYVTALENWMIAALADFGVEAFVHDAGTGIWVERGGGIAKIGAIGVRVRRWICFHGLALNVSTDMTHFDAIIPCGIADHGVARLMDLVPDVQMDDVDQALYRHLPAMLDAISTI